MKLSYFKLLFLFLVFSACSNAEDVAFIIQDKEENIAKQPNILLIIADDMGLDATPNYNIDGIKPNMPILQSLMSNGIKFNNLWSYPLCTPTRASILTGKYGFRTEVTNVGHNLSSNEQSIQNYLDGMNSGYSHAVIGKWHLSGDISHPNAIGIDEYTGVLGGGVQSYWNWNLVENMQSSKSTEYTTTKFTDLAINWIGSQNQPWFLWLAYNAPHTPFHLPPSELYSQVGLASDQSSIDANPLPYYLAMLEAMDTEMGRLINSMSQEERDNTFIVFIGDNGTPNQVVQTYPNRRAKNSLYQGGVNVPMVISGKNVERKGVEEEALLCTTDLFATIAGIAGSNISEINDSKNFKSMFNAPGITVRDYVYSEIGDDINNLDHTIRNDKYKLMKFSSGNEALYHLAEDPLESINLLDANRLPLSEEAQMAKEALESEIINIKS
ncbi:sulfatase-like hydrolase/transferase [uncultured Algibacter sp.]|uniref:sulfatase-like hydrolase/transferase n=1 Tax=uncultured Algibacter sp. TaxID=298659 RepID=UPI0025FA47A9|nr:sulfatase-like hydrolase/transferase [uncultured Algibacter sp.]